MDSPASETFPPQIELVLAHTPQALRLRFAAYFALDQRLARIVSNTTEPMLGQMRLAWWRDMLRTDLNSRPSGDAVLDAIGEHWQGDDEILVELVDGWEILVAEESISRKEISDFANKRAGPLAGLLADLEEQVAARVMSAGMRWVMADTACKVSDEAERQQLIDIGLGLKSNAASLPGALRGLAILEALSLRALKRGGRPLMEGRGAALITMRASIFGR
ncbi:MAG: hypothetical protein AAF250_01160 [Pseudomonadota bacterium]